MPNNSNGIEFILPDNADDAMPKLRWKNRTLHR
jgi:hypothetical protein